MWGCKVQGSGLQVLDDYGVELFLVVGFMLHVELRVFSITSYGPPSPKP